MLSDGLQTPAGLIFVKVTEPVAGFVAVKLVGIVTTAFWVVPQVAPVLSAVKRYMVPLVESRIGPSVKPTPRESCTDFTTTPAEAVTAYNCPLRKPAGLPSATKTFPEASSKTGLVAKLPAVKVTGQVTTTSAGLPLNTP